MIKTKLAKKKKNNKTKKKPQRLENICLSGFNYLPNRHCLGIPKNIARAITVMTLIFVPDSVPGTYHTSFTPYLVKEEGKNVFVVCLLLLIFQPSSVWGQLLLSFWALLACFGAVCFLNSKHLPFSYLAAFFINSFPFIIVYSKTPRG